MSAPSDELRRWVRSRRAAEQREQSESLARRRDPIASLRTALSLIAFARARHGWPLPVDPRDEVQDLQAYERWAFLRRRAMS